MAGLPEDALACARALRVNAPADADSHALFILMKEAEGASLDSVPELSQAFVELLQCDPASEHAVQGEQISACVLQLRLPGPCCFKYEIPSEVWMGIIFATLGYDYYTASFHLG